MGQRIFVNLTKREARVNSDFLKVTVRFKNGKIQSDFHAAISEIDDVAKEKETHIAPLNIMILTFDGTSTAHFKRLLPKTYAYLRDGLDSIFFKGYSIVGESTTPAMTAFLTGKSVSENCEFKEARRGHKNSSYVDKWPFIFKELKRLGIATMWSEDQPGIGEYFRVIFSCLSKVIRDCMGFALLCSVISPENSSHSLNQSGAKLKPITT